MIITCEISLYPLIKDYEEVIFKVIKTLKSNGQLLVKTHAMSTFVKGNHDEVFVSLNQIYDLPEMGDNASSLVIKIINRDLPVEDGFIF